MKRKLLYIFILTLILYAAYFHLIKSNIKFKVQIKEFICEKLIKQSICQNLNNSYNQKFLPETQLANLELKKINLDDNYNYKKKFLEVAGTKLLIVQNDGYIKSIELSNYSNNEQKEIVVNNIESNLNKLIEQGKTGQILDIAIYKNKLYASYFNFDSANCKLLNISVTNIDLENFKFTNLIKFDECQDGPIQAGRLKPFIKDGQEGLLFTLGQNSQNSLNMKAQDDNSIYGKILFINLAKKEFEIFAKGFRNPQGLFVENNLIIATDHGPRGGDEINKVLKNKNYGWPIASYGEPYGEGRRDRNNKFLLKNYYKKNHSDYGYLEPLYAFIPSIGISEIIKVSNNFHPKWSNNFLVSSLGGKSIYRVKFDQKYSRVLLAEKIYIGNRIRDLIYNEELNLIFLALEDFGQIGILKSGAP
jgi:glucose/arabinose dehydrogenase